MRLLPLVAALGLSIFICLACAESDGIDVDSVAGETDQDYSCQIVCQDDSGRSSRSLESQVVCAASKTAADEFAKTSSFQCFGKPPLAANCLPLNRACSVSPPSPAW